MHKSSNRKGWRIEDNKESEEPFGDYKYVYSEYSSKFIGHCMPLKYDSSANVEYVMDATITAWIQLILDNWDSAYFNENNELFKFHLEVRYTTQDFKLIIDLFELYWEYVLMDYEATTDELVYKYILRSKKIKN